MDRAFSKFFTVALRVKALADKLPTDLKGELFLARIQEGYIPFYFKFNIRAGLGMLH